MQTEEIKELYAQKTGTPPGPAVAKFIDGLRVREVAKIWSLMGDGEDFVSAIKRLVADAIKKAGGDEGMGDHDLDSWLVHLDDLRRKAELEKEEKARAKERERERIEAERAELLAAEQERKEAERVRAEVEAREADLRRERAAREADEARAREEETRLREAEAQAARETAERAAAAAAEREAAEHATQAKDAEERAAQESRLAEAKLAREQAEAAQHEAEQRLAAERDAAEKAKQRTSALLEAKQMMETELAHKRREEEAAKAAREAQLQHLEELQQQDEQDATEEDVSESDTSEEAPSNKSDSQLMLPVTIRLNEKDEPMGIHGLLCLGSKVRAVDLTEGSPADRAGLKPATVLRELHGMPITSKEDLKNALHQVRKEGLKEFEMIVEPPLTKDELTKDMDKIREERRLMVKDRVMKAMERSKMLVVEMTVVGGKSLAGTSKNVFCECKLRTVKDGIVGSDHANPQKTVTSTIKGTLDPVFDHSVRLFVPPNDAIRLSVFGSKTIGKEYKGRVDLILKDVVPSLNLGGKTQAVCYPLLGEEGRGNVSGLLEVGLKVTGFVPKDK